jgi:hypothetical protein
MTPWEAWGPGLLFGPCRVATRSTEGLTPTDRGWPTCLEAAAAAQETGDCSQPLDLHGGPWLPTTALLSTVSDKAA